MADHRDLANSELHEPLHMKTLTGGATDIGKVIVSKGDGTSEARKLDSSDVNFTPQYEVVVNSTSDFPAPVSGVITLADDTCYIIGADITLTDRFQLGTNNQITSCSTNGVTLTYSGAGTMFTGSSVDFGISNMRLNCPNGKLFDMTGGLLRIDFTTVVSTSKDGTFTNVTGVVTFRTSWLDSDDGFTFVGTSTTPLLNLKDYRWSTLSATAIHVDLGTTQFTNLIIDTSLMTGVAGAKVLKGLTAGGNLLANVPATVSNNNFGTDMTVLDGIGVNDNRWRFSNNVGTNITDTIIAEDAYMTTTETVTINTAGVYEQIGGVNWQSDLDAGFTTSTAGVITYDRDETITVLVVATATLAAASGTDTLAARLAVNGTTVERSQGQTTNATATSVTCTATIELSTGNTLEMQVANLDTTVNIDVNVSSINVIRVLA